MSYFYQINFKTTSFRWLPSEKLAQSKLCSLSLKHKSRLKRHYFKQKPEIKTKTTKKAYEPKPLSSCEPRHRPSARLITQTLAPLSKAPGDGNGDSELLFAFFLFSNFCFVVLVFWGFCKNFGWRNRCWNSQYVYNLNSLFYWNCVCVYGEAFFFF